MKQIHADRGVKCDYRGTRKRRVRARGVTFWVEEEGAGRPLLLIHGGPGADHRSLHPGLSVLAKSRRLIYVDLRGHGMSSEARRYGLEVDADDVEALRRAMKLGKLDALGHSYGGAVVLKWAARHPAGAGKIVVCSTPLGASDRQILARMARDPRAKEVRGAEDDFEKYLRFYYERNPGATLRRFARLVRANFGSAKNRRLLEAREKDDAAWDWSGFLRPVKCPVLLLYGARDPIVPWRVLRKTARHFKNLSCHGFPRSRHQPFDDEPEAFRKRVLEFL